jgi:hypothetical protein
MLVPLSKQMCDAFQDCVMPESLSPQVFGL